MYEDLVRRLREYAEWARASEWETPLCLEDDLLAVAGTIERLVRERDAAVDDLHKLVPAWRWNGEPSAPKDDQSTDMTPTINHVEHGYEVRPCGFCTNARVDDDPVVIAAQCTPTIDPYKHGEWIRYEDTHDHTIKYICPICYDYTAFRDDPGEYTVRGNYIYCRKCGAKMGG